MTFGSPIWLYLIPPVIAALVAVGVFARRARLRALERFAAPALLPELLSAYSVGRSRFKAALIALGIASLFVALARPQIGYEWREVKAKGVDLVIAMDVSKSMLARDIKPDRLERAKLAVLDLIDKLKGDRIGLVAFSGEAFLQCPLTLDYDAFRQSLEALDTDVIPREGTDLGAAISEAVAAFDVTSNQKVVVLITDGEDLEGTGLAQAKKAAEKGVVIYTVGVGTPQGDLIPVRDAQGRDDFLRDASTGKIVTTRLEDSTLVAVADAGHGFYTPLGPTGEGLWKVYESGWLKRPQEDLASRQQRTPIERFQWPLALSIFLFAWEPIVGTRKRFFLRLLRRRAPAALAVTLALFAASDLRADGDAAREAYAQGEYEKAAAQWAKEGEAKPDGRADFNQGASLYKLGDYAQAAKAFNAALAKQAPTAQKDTFFNLGNTRFMQGLPLEQSNAKEALSLWEQALKDYDNALELAPNDADATHNRAYVEKRIEALKKREEEKKKQQQQQQQNQQQNQNQQNQNQDQQNKDQKDQQNQQQNQSSQNDQNQKQDQKQNQEQKDQNQQKQDQQNKQQGQDKQPQNQQPQNSSQNQDQKQDKSSEQNKEQQEQKDKDKQQGQSDKSKQDEEKQKQDEQKSGQGDQQKQEPKPEEKKNEPGKDQSSADKDKQEQKDKAQPEGSGKDKPEQKPQLPRDTRGDSQQDAQEQRGPDNKGVAEAPKPAEEKPSAEQKAAAAAAQAEREKQAKEEAQAAAAAAAAGVMTRQDAGFLLDSLKTQERKLPAAPIRVNGQPQNDNTRKPFKNW